ncbi:hypothetical protein C2845_PM12G30780 [Panicum miliaceum]|uniref:Uncharacterized protein n=1 Tax=Panicum miliaceum TaxID=4540 RepID=A0A3L6QCX1_PANMI|nr:hypothetical protein C2845_PM12G30780 [Panicum miliaceum]
MRLVLLIRLHGGARSVLMESMLRGKYDQVSCVAVLRHDSGCQQGSAASVRGNILCPNHTASPPGTFVQQAATRIVHGLMDRRV